MSTPHERPQAEPAIEIIRLKPGERRSLFLLSATWYGANTHFLGRTKLCVGEPDCPACFSGNVPRWYGYIPVHQAKRGLGMIELTPRAAESLESIMNQPSFYGWAVTAFKPSQRMPIVFSDPKHLGKSRIQEVPTDQVEQHLCRIWQLPTTKRGEDVAAWRTRLRQAAINSLAKDVASMMG